MEFKSINPHTEALLATYPAHSDQEIVEKLKKAEKAFQHWRKVPLPDRARHLFAIVRQLRDRREDYARLMTLEMGKPIRESRSEIDKCAWVCEYYAENAASFLADQEIATDARRSFVRHAPLGAILAVMPWNFPFWQVFRFAAPAFMAGNVGLLKHASNVMGCAQQIEALFLEAGLPEGVFQNLRIDHSQTADVIAHPVVKAATVTGSEKAGSAVASLAGQHLKKTVLELGGSNAFIVWEDADLEQVIQTALTARMLNTGQSCIAAKRFILLEGIYEEFVEKYIEAVQQLKAGDPLEDATDLGPLARKDLADELQRQVKESLEQGAQLLWGGKQRGCFHEATILGEVKAGMPAFEEETFGPLAAMIRAKDIEEAFALSEQSAFGLGVTLCTRNIEKALAMSDRVSDGAYFINELVKSDPRLPFGGTKRSGYGRELSRDGILEFVNRKTVYVKG